MQVARCRRRLRLWPADRGSVRTLHVDGRLADLPEVDLPSSAGPFATARVPEDLEELRDRELKTIGRAVSAAKIPVPHPAIQTLLDRDEKERGKAAANRWHTPVVLYESPFEKWRLRILDAVFLTLARMGHHATSERDGNLTTFTVVIGDTRVPLTLDEATKKAVAYNRYDAPRPDPKRLASVPLRLTAGSSTWQDDGSEKLEARIAEISAGLIVEDERAYRTHLCELEEQAERRRIEAERQRQERLRKANAERAAALLKSGRLLAEAENLRSLIARVGAAVADGRLDLSADQLTDGRQWADREADRLDPVLSGQVRAHLLPPDDVG